MEIAISIIIGAIAGGTVLYLVMKREVAREKTAGETLKREVDELKRERERVESEKVELIRSNAEMGSSIQHLKEQIERERQESGALKDQIQKEFQLVAAKVLEEKSGMLVKTNKEGISSLLNPLRERIVEFEKKVEETYSKERSERFSLQERIKELVELNNRLGTEANNLAKALKNNSKKQGDWGEYILESILDKSGLTRDREYFVQKAMEGTDGHKSLRPDVRIMYPDGKEIIVDAKVSLTHYTDFINAESEELSQIALRNHLDSVNRHVTELSEKSYQDFVQSLDFVMMFIPNEGAYMVALQADPSLWQKAYDKRVIIISPTHLITALKLVYDLWSREYQNRHAMQIAERGSLLYDKFVTFAETMVSVGKGIDDSKLSYDKAMKQLTEGNGNLVAQSKKLIDLGVKAKKKLPPSLTIEEEEETTTPQLTAKEEEPERKP